MKVIKLAEKQRKNEHKKSSLETQKLPKETIDKTRQIKLTVEQLLEEAVIKNKGKEEWSNMCYIPVERALVELQNILSQEDGVIEDRSKYDANVYKSASMMAAFAGWDKNDNKIKSATLNKNVSDVAYMINTNSIFEQTGFGLHIHCNFKYKEYVGCDFEGVFVHINHTFLPAPHDLELRAYFISENKKDIFPCNLTLMNGKTLSTCLCETLLIDEKDVSNDRYIPTLEEIERCEDEYQKDLLYYQLKYKIFKDLFHVLFL